LKENIDSNSSMTILLLMKMKRKYMRNEEMIWRNTTMIEWWWHMQYTMCMKRRSNMKLYSISMPVWRGRQCRNDNSANVN